MPETAKPSTLGQTPTAVQRALDTLTRLAATSLRIPFAGLVLVGSGRRVITSVHGVRSVPETLGAWAPRRYLSKKIFRTGEPLVIPDLAAWAMCAPDEKYSSDASGSFLGVPVSRLDGTICGTLHAIASEPRAWQAMDIEMLRDIASLATDQLELLEAKAQREAQAANSEPDREASDDVLCVLDSECRIIEAGARAVEVWGYEASDLVGRKVSELLSPPERSGADQRLAQVASQGRRAELANLCIRKDGGLHKVYWTVLWCPEEQTYYAITRNSPAVPAARSAAGSSERILVVDDYREIGLLVRTALQFADFSNVQIASTPLRAIEIARQGPLALVIADLRMEPMNGVELLHELRRMPHLKQVPFIIISGYLKPEMIGNLKRAGVTSFLAKPFRANDVVRHALGALRPQADVPL